MECQCPRPESQDKIVGPIVRDKKGADSWPRCCLLSDSNSRAPQKHVVALPAAPTCSNPRTFNSVLWKKIEDKLSLPAHTSFLNSFITATGNYHLINMSSHHLSELDSTTDSVASSPRSEHHAPHDARVRFMCSFGGKILPRPHDNQLRYVGGDTRIIAVHRSTSFAALLTKLSKLSGIANVSVKYQLPNEDLDALISVATDEDLENMMEEYDRLAQNHNPRLARLRIFLFSKGDDSRTSSISSLLDGSVNREHWFFDALNSGANASGLERGRSEVSSIVSEVPDYLFGLDNSDEAQPPGPKLSTRQLLHENVSVSDPGSPAPVVSSSPFCSTSSAPVVVPSMPDLPPVKTKPDNPEPGFESKQNQTESLVEQPVSQPTTYSGSPMWHYIPGSHYSVPPAQQIPVYYVPGPVQPGNPQVQPVQIRPQYVQQYPMSTGQIPVGYHQPVAGVGQAYRPVTHVDPYDPALRVAPDGVKQPIYYGVRNAGPVPVYSGMVVPGGEELGRSGSDSTQGRVSQ
ncbi:Phox/Bem1p [Gossypium australe]|uniref:Phox/Bem1p n=2 Tax=Gossypium australe TaxID=47621 RepID=A0A5B6W9N9_9ROSI|nr:Phox/Bem1p [Gossypium australe]